MFLLAGLLFVFPEVVGLLLLVLLVVIVAIPLSRAGTRLERLHVPRWIGVPLTLLLALAIIGGIIALLVPSFVNEGRALVNGLPDTIESLQRKFNRATNSHGRAG